MFAIFQAVYLCLQHSKKCVCVCVCSIMSKVFVCVCHIPSSLYVLAALRAISVYNNPSSVFMCLQHLCVCLQDSILFVSAAFQAVCLCVFAALRAVFTTPRRPPWWLCQRKWRSLCPSASTPTVVTDTPRCKCSLLCLLGTSWIIIRFVVPKFLETKLRGASVQQDWSVARVDRYSSCQQMVDMPGSCVGKSKIIKICF